MSECEWCATNAKARTGEFLRNHEELVAGRVLGVEGLVEGEMLLLQREQIRAVDVREGCIVLYASPMISNKSPTSIYIKLPRSPPPGALFSISSPKGSNIFEFDTGVNDKRKKTPPLHSLTLLVAQGQQFPFTFADVGSGDGLDGEVVAGEGEGFFLHVEGHGLGEALGEGWA